MTFLEGTQSADLAKLKELTESLRIRDAEVRASEWRFRSLANMSSDGIMIVDDQGIVTYANPAADALFGLSLANKPLSIIIPPRFRQAHADAYALMVEESTKTGSDYLRKQRRRPAMRADGTEFIVEYSSSSWRSEDGRVMLSAIFRDATRETEDEMRKQNMTRLMRAYLDVSPSLYVVISRDGTVVYCNHEMKISTQVVEGKSFTEFVYADDMDNVVAEFGRLISSQAPYEPSTYVNRVKTRNGDAVWVVWRSVTIRRPGMVAVVSSGIVIEDINGLVGAINTAE